MLAPTMNKIKKKTENAVPGERVRFANHFFQPENFRSSDFEASDAGEIFFRIIISRRLIVLPSYFRPSSL